MRIWLGLLQVGLSKILWQSLVRTIYKFGGLDSPYSATGYGVNWSKQQQRCLERDNYTCRVCNTSGDELDRQPAVHHIKPRSEFDGTPMEMNDLDNLITLCPSCHGRYEGRFLNCSPEEFAKRAQQT